MPPVTEHNNKKLEEKIDKLSDIINQLAIGQARLEEKIISLDRRVESFDKRLEKIETSQDTLIKDVSDLKGVKSLIVPLIVAVTTSLLTLLIRAIPNP
jgi:exonuclease VII small subunit